MLKEKNVGNGVQSFNMYLLIFLIASVVCLTVSIVLSVIFGKSGAGAKILTPLNILFVGVIMSAVLLFIPLCQRALENSGCNTLESVVVAIYKMMRLFIAEGEIELITSNLDGVPVWLFHCYTGFSCVLFFLAPFLTFGFVLSFFQNLSSRVRYWLNFGAEAYIFSELNERSLILARSLCENDNRKSVIVFCDVSKKVLSSEICDDARALGAVMFENDIDAIRFSFHSKRKNINFFVMGTDASQNVICALRIIDQFGMRNKTSLYVFSDDEESEILLSNAIREKQLVIKVRRINAIRSLINRTLYDSAYQNIFCSAYKTDNDKEINAVIVGMGRYGTKMTKALTWMCQMDGYRLTVSSFDADPFAEQRFCSVCPELMDDRHNGKYDDPGEAQYKIKIFSDVDVYAKAFDDIAASLAAPTYVFVALGDDSKNICTAVKLRTLFLRRGLAPVIQTVVYSNDKSTALTNACNFKGQEYDIDFIGNIDSCYSKDVIINSDVERLALQRHLKWGDEKQFWQYEYNYRSSVASAIHSKMKKLCNIPGSEKAPCDRSESERISLRMLEHRRWNAYIRSEGYIFGERNDLAKTHNCLVPFDELSLEYQEKDDD